MSPRRPRNCSTVVASFIVHRPLLPKSVSSEKHSSCVAAASLLRVRATPRALALILPSVSVRMVSILSDSLYLASRRMRPLVVWYICIASQSCGGAVRVWPPPRRISPVPAPASSPARAFHGSAANRRARPSRKRASRSCRPSRLPPLGLVFHPSGGSDMGNFNR